MRYIKQGIGCLVMMMIFGTVMFSVQVFAGEFQPVSFQNTTGDADASAAQAKDTDSDFPTAESDASPSSGAIAHSMNRRADVDGFLAAPWIPVSYIRQSANESPLLQQNPKYLRTYTIKAYPAYNKNAVTDRTIRIQSNPDSLIQAFTFHISKLTAG